MQVTSQRPQEDPRASPTGPKKHPRAGRTGKSRMMRRRSRDLLRGNGVEEAEEEEDEEGGFGQRGEIERVDRKGGN